MKKSIIAMIMGICVLFTSAVGLCARVLQSPTPVGVFETGLKIVIDAGHGGVDGGVMGKLTRKKESDLNLSITYALKAELEEFGFEIVLTRKTEAGLYDVAMKGFKGRDMQKRREIIQETRPAMVISIHQNFYPSKLARGGQVFYESKSAPSQALAESLQNSLNRLYSEEGAKARKAMKGEFFILECADCPSVIVECGFLSNEKDEALLCNGVWQRKLAQNLASGVLGYFSDNSA